MEDYSDFQPIRSDSGRGLEVFRAFSVKRNASVVVKVYVRRDTEELGPFLRAALRYSRSPQSGALLDLVVCQPAAPLYHICWVQAQDSGPDDQTDDIVRGFSGILLGKVMYENNTTGVTVSEGLIEATSEPAVIKAYWEREMRYANLPIKEIIAQGRAEHERTVSLLDVRVVKDKNNIGFEVVLVMERLKEDLRSTIRRKAEKREKVTEKELHCCLLDVTAGLLHAKFRVRLTQDVAHRDLKPANIFVGQGGCFKVGDFSSAWEKTPRGTAVTPSGSPSYMSPEMRKLLQGATCPIDPFASDVFSLGVTVVHFGLLRCPEALDSEALDTEELTAAVQKAMEELSCSGALKDLLASMLSAAPQERPSLEAVRAALLSQDDDEVTATADQRPSPGLSAAADYADLALVYSSQGRMLQAEEVCLRAFAALESCGDCPSVRARLFRKLCPIFLAQKRLIDAECVCAKAMELAPDDKRALAACYGYLAIIHRKRGRLQEAEDAAMRAIRLWSEGGNCDNDRLASTYTSLLLVRLAQDRLSEAEEAGLRALAVQRQNFPANHPVLAKTYTNLSQVYMRQGRLAEAEQTCIHALHLKRLHYGEEDWGLASCLGTLSQVYLRQGRFAQAEEIAEQALRLAEKRDADVTGYQRNLQNIRKLASSSVCQLL